MLPEYNISDLEDVSKYPSRTYKFDPETNHISGYVDELESIKQSIYLMLSTERYAWLIYNWYYGVEYDTLIGKNIDYVSSEVQRRTKECLLEDDRILDVNNFTQEFKNGTLLLNFIVQTTYGEFEYRTEVKI